MITLDPETGEPNPDVMRCVAKQHDGTAGVYSIAASSSSSALVVKNSGVFRGNDLALTPGS